jgi:anthranilate synthase component I
MTTAPNSAQELTGFFPRFREVQNMTEARGSVAIHRDILADLDTPVSAFLKVKEGNLNFLFESVEGGERVGRYSFLGNGSWRWQLDRDTAQPGDTLDGGITPADFGELRRRLDEMNPVNRTEDSAFAGGALGYLSYESSGHAERLPMPDNDLLGLPDGLFMGVDTLLVFDHLRHTIRVVSHMSLEGDRNQNYVEAAGRIDGLIAKLRGAISAEAYDTTPAADQKGYAQPRSNVSPRQFEDMVRAAQEYIKSGDIIQAVLSQRLSVPLQGEPFTVYRALRTVSPSPYMYFLEFGDHQIVGASPELLVQVEDGKVNTHRRYPASGIHSGRGPGAR